jgi:hypothetical protein
MDEQQTPNLMPQCRSTKVQWDCQLSQGFKREEHEINIEKILN